MAPRPVAEAETLRAEAADRTRREGRGRGRGTVGAILIAGLTMSMALAGPLSSWSRPVRWWQASISGDVDPANPLVFSGAAVLAVATLASRWLGLGRAGALSLAACISLGWQARLFLREPINANAASPDFGALVLAVLTPFVFAIAFGGLWLLTAWAARVRIELRRAASRLLGVGLLIVSTVTIVAAARRHASYPDPRSARASVEALGSFDGGEDGNGPASSRNRLVSGPWTLTMQAKGIRDCRVHVAASGQEVGAFAYDERSPAGGRPCDLQRRGLFPHVDRTLSKDGPCGSRRIRPTSVRSTRRGLLVPTSGPTALPTSAPRGRPFAARHLDRLGARRHGGRILLARTPRSRPSRALDLERRDSRRGRRPRPPTTRRAGLPRVGEIGAQCPGHAGGGPRPTACPRDGAVDVCDRRSRSYVNAAARCRSAGIRLLNGRARSSSTSRHLAEHDLPKSIALGRLEARGFEGLPAPTDRLNQGFVIEDHEP